MLARLCPSAALVALLLTAAPRTALACWDGYAASGARSRVAHATSEGASWSADRARELSALLGQVDALIPAGYNLDVSSYGELSLCPTDEDWGPCIEGSDRWEDGAPATLRSLAAALVHADHQTQARVARTRPPPVYTVQLIALRSQAAAEAFAAKLNDHENEERHGFYIEGGFPAWNQWAHVVEGRTSSGARVFRVWAGAYLAQDEARTAAHDLEPLAGHRPLVKQM